MNIDNEHTKNNYFKHSQEVYDVYSNYLKQNGIDGICNYHYKHPYFKDRGGYIHYTIKNNTETSLYAHIFYFPHNAIRIYIYDVPIINDKASCSLNDIFTYLYLPIEHLIQKYNFSFTYSINICYRKFRHLLYRTEQLEFTYNDNILTNQKFFNFLNNGIYQMSLDPEELLVSTLYVRNEKIPEEINLLLKQYANKNNLYLKYVR